MLTGIATWVQKRFVGEKKALEVPMVGEGDPARGARADRASQARLVFGVTQSRMTPSTTTVPSSRTPVTRTGRSGSSPVPLLRVGLGDAGDVAGRLGGVG